MTYYIDNESPEQGDGSREHPLRSGLNLPLEPGDHVHYHRGRIFHEIIEGAEGVSFGAYGEGENPILTEAVDLSDPALWKEVRPHVWQCLDPGPSEIGNLIFNADDCGGVLRWSPQELSAQGEFWDSAFGTNKRPEAVEEPRCFLLYSEKNPGEFYQSIEGAVFGHRLLVHLKSGMTLEDLTFQNSGVHGAQGSGDNITICRCAFLRIGGCAWSRERKIRFGNGVEFWDHARNIRIEDCVFRDIYDSCATFQGSSKCESTVNFVCRRNHFNTYGMAAFEYRDRVPVNSVFEDNLCEKAGCGFAMAGYPLPRASEIWPEPMGHHLFFWRMDRPAINGSLRIAGNIFGSSPQGYAVYLRIDPEAARQLHFENNSFSHDSLGEIWGPMIPGSQA